VKLAGIKRTKYRSREYCRGMNCEYTRMKSVCKGVIRPHLWTLLIPLLVGCATSTIESRRVERLAAYQSLSPEQQQLVDQGQIRVGMTSDAVYIAWGPPSEVLQSEDASGHTVIWRYYGTWTQETRYWTYREVNRGKDDIYLERYLATDYNPRDYVRAEILIKDGKVSSWRTLPRPTH
jgi:hypothetical protein